MPCGMCHTLLPVGEMYLHARMFCALAHTSSIQMCAINFYIQECFLHLLIPLPFSCLRCIYMQECSVHSLCMSSIPIGAMSELETCFEPLLPNRFVTVDFFFALYTRSYVFYSHLCNKFLHARTFFALADMI